MIWVAGNILSSLAGDWLLDRSIEDAESSAPMAGMRGTAYFTPAGPAEATYSEQGVLSFRTGQSVDARRTYHYRQRGSGLDIFFDEERVRLFHRLVLRDDDKGGLVASDLHLCAADHYDGLYRFRPDGSFSVEYTVRGPHKSYRSATVYRRAATGQGGCP